jgi:hypothetical protein
MKKIFEDLDKTLKSMGAKKLTKKEAQFVLNTLLAAMPPNGIKMREREREKEKKRDKENERDKERRERREGREGREREERERLRAKKFTKKAHFVLSTLLAAPPNGIIKMRGRERLRKGERGERERGVGDKANQDKTKQNKNKKST